MLHDILKDFPGSQDGRFTENFKAGTQADLSDYLAAIVVPAGWARPVQAAEAEEKPPVVTDTTKRNTRKGQKS